MRAFSVVLPLLFTTYFPVSAFYIHVYGIVTDHFTGKPIRGVQVLMVKDSIERGSISTDRNGRYEFYLERGYPYELHFSGKGLVTKIIAIDAREIPLFPDVPFFEMDIQVSMIMAIDDHDLSAYKTPVGLAEYKHSVRNLNWETELTKARRTELQRVMIDYQRELIARQKLTEREALKAGKKKRGTVFF